MDQISQTINVLFVCMGNICRSPAGEGIFRHYVEQAGHSERIFIDSAGVSDYHTGELADQRMRAAAVNRGYSLNSIARQVQATDLDRFDLIVAMDHDNLNELERLAGGPQSHIRLLGSFLTEGGNNLNGPSVPDPYFGGEAGFEEVMDMIEKACPAMFDYCQQLIDVKS